MSVAIADKFRRFCPKCFDFHTHFLQRDVFDASHPHSVSSSFGRNMIPIDIPMMQSMFDPVRQIADMNERGIDMQLLCSCDVVQSRMWAEPDEEARLTRLVNAQCSDWVGRYPNRFVGSGVLPLGNMRMAIKELEWIRSNGLRVVQLPANFRGDYLGHERFDELWAALREANLVAFVHPEGVTDMWFQDYALWNSIGQSIEEVRAMSSLIYKGVMERHRGVKIVMAHGGGYMPHYMGRLDRNFVEKPFTTANLTKKPSEYLAEFYYDSCVYDARTLELLIERVGIDRIVLGGDYPVAAVDPIDFLDTLSISDADKAKVAGGNALRLLGIN
ncbi:amidohydrolase family protein [Sphingomonas sp.]|uniref:amidohydrolase family protein n=1 Tax=Sphingomonas sp. TaxID=28214 RepID=UPI0025F1974B|nr:amidohydrolase family protein [Sphingomonas sp.]